MNLTLPLPSLTSFLGLLLRVIGVTFAVLGTSLGLGIAGYHWIGHLPWVDAFLNASMILAGMGPVDPLEGAPAKLFASVYALFSGVVFLSSVGVLVTPVAHRMIHWLHLELTDEAAPPAGAVAKPPRA